MNKEKASKQSKNGSGKILVSQALGFKVGTAPRGVWQTVNFRVEISLTDEVRQDSVPQYSDDLMPPTVE